MKKRAIINVIIMIAGIVLCSIIHIGQHHQALCYTEHLCGFILLITAFIKNRKLWIETNKNQYIGILMVINAVIIILYLITFTIISIIN